jgi:hypothetical protein
VSRALAGLCGLAVLVGLALWLIPDWQVAPTRLRLQSEGQLTAAERLLLEKELFEAENGARSTLALIFGGAALLIGLGVGWRRYETSREQLGHERFAAAVEQLASDRADGTPRTEARLGGFTRSSDSRPIRTTSTGRSWKC